MTAREPARIELVAAAGIRADTIIADTGKLVTVESPSNDRAAVRHAARAVVDLIHRRLGTDNAHTEIVEVDGVTHVMLRFGTGPRTLLLVAHHDTVWPHGTLLKIPFSHTDGVMRGPGTFDMKAGIVMAVHALDLLQKSYGPEILDGVSMFVSGDEEIGSLTSRDLIESEATGCRAALVLEPAGPGGAVKTGRKGTSLYHLVIEGRAAHAGVEPERGINASVELAHQILAVLPLADPALGTSVTPTALSAGTTVNTVPASAALSIDVRAWTAAEQERVDAGIRSLKPALDGSTITVNGGINRPPLELATTAGVYEHANAVSIELGLGELAHIAVGGGSDGNFTGGMGVPTLDGLGAFGGGAHAENEHVLTDGMTDRTALLAALIARIQSTPEPAASVTPAVSVTS